MIIPSEDDALFIPRLAEALISGQPIRTSDVFLFRRGLIWIGGLLYVHDEFRLRLVLVHRARWIVDLIAVDIVVGLARAGSRVPTQPGETLISQEQVAYTDMFPSRTRKKREQGGRGGGERRICSFGCAP